MGIFYKACFHILGLLCFHENSVVSPDMPKKPTKTPDAAFAVLAIGGKQYIVRAGETFKTEKIIGKDKTFSVDDVLFYDDGKTSVIGTPKTGKTAQLEIIEEGRHDKLTVIKYKAKSRYFKKRGHRQPFAEVKVVSIG